MVLSKYLLKIKWSESFFLILIVSVERSRYLYETFNFNSVYLGVLKYLGILYLTYKLIININRKYRLTFFISIFLGIAYGCIAMLLNNSLSNIVPDVVRFFVIFILPYAISITMPRESLERVLGLYFDFIIAYPVIILLLLIIGRVNIFFGSRYIIYDSIVVLNLGVLLLTNSYEIRKLTKTFLVLMYMFIIMLAPTTGNFVIILLYGLLMLSKLVVSKSMLLKSLFIIFTSGLLFLSSIVYLNIEKVDLDNPMLELKINQLLSLRSIGNIEKLPSSVKVRVKEFQLIFNNHKALLIVGNGYGGVIIDDGTMGELNETSYSEGELKSRCYNNLHSFISNIILQYGIVGLLFSIVHFLVFYKKTKGTKYNLLVIPYVLQSFWGLKLLLIISVIYAYLLLQEKINNLKSVEISV
ncbi:hypothetical protein WG909_07545 [Peptostreptococcaceae bacterium AGR-M142]